MTVYDIAGNPVNEDDVVAVAVTYDRSASMRIGKVVEVVPERPADPANYRYSATPAKIRVEWTLGYSLPDKKTLVSVRDALVLPHGVDIDASNLREYVDLRVNE